MKQKSPGLSGESSKNSAVAPSKPAVPYSLIMSLDELQIPVFEVVRSIVRPVPASPQQKENENVIRNKRPLKSLTRSTASLTMSVLSPEKSARKEISLCKKNDYQTEASREYRKFKERHQFSQKVNKMFHKKYSYEVDEGSNIDRLNAKLDKYILRYLIGQKSSSTLQ